MEAARRRPHGSTHVRVVADAELIARVLRGDPLAERALFDRHVDAVYQVAFRVSGDSDDAADCVQETFVRAFKSLDQFRGDAAFSTWLRSIALKVIFTHERKRRRFAGPAEADDLPDARADALQETSGLTSRVDATLECMSDKLRVVFLLYDVEGYSHDEISSALGIPVGTSKARLSEARAVLRVALRDFRHSGSA
jgi:RNA polymerase sigma-70 factor (ECF subfamily)